MTKTKHTEASVTALLREKYSAPEWAFLAGVPNATGFGKSRTADGIAMSLWPSRGLHLYGFEIKVSRSDWMKEVQDPAKAEAFARYCHVWQIVAPKGIVKVEELPPEWGLLEITDAGNLRAKKAVAPTEPRAPVDMNILAGLMRSMSNDLESQFRAVRYQAAAEVREGAKRAAEAQVESERTLIARREESVNRVCEILKEELGIHISGTEFRIEERVRQQCRAAAQLARLVPAGMDGSLASVLHRMQRAVAEHGDSVRRIVEIISDTSQSPAPQNPR